MRYLILLIPFLFGCEQPETITSHSCNPDGQPLNTYTLVWEHEEHHTGNIQYHLYYDAIPIETIGQEFFGIINTTDLSAYFDPIALGIPKCSTMYFRVTASYIQCPLSTCLESSFSNQVSILIY